MKIAFLPSFWREGQGGVEGVDLPDWAKRGKDRSLVVDLNGDYDPALDRENTRVFLSAREGLSWRCGNQILPIRSQAVPPEYTNVGEALRRLTNFWMYFGGSWLEPADDDWRQHVVSLP